MADPKRPLFHIIPLDERDLPGTDDESDDAGQPRDVPVRAAVKFDQLGHELGLQQTPQRPRQQTPHPAGSEKRRKRSRSRSRSRESSEDREQRLDFKRRALGLRVKVNRLVKAASAIRKDCITLNLPTCTCMHALYMHALLGHPSVDGHPGTHPYAVVSRDVQPQVRRRGTYVPGHVEPRSVEGNAALKTCNTRMCLIKCLEPPNTHMGRPTVCSLQHPWS